MEAIDALEIIAFLQERGVRLWIGGGWGVDALLNEETRHHADLDLAVEIADSDLYEQAVAAEGFRFLYFDPANDQDGRHLNWVVKDETGREIDVHLVDTSVESISADGTRVYGGIPYPVGSLDGAGVIAGIPVRCVTAAYQMTSHTGYEIKDTDVHDVLSLYRRFGLPLPREYGAAARAEPPLC